MKMFVVFALALQVCAGVDNCGTCNCYQKKETTWWWPLWNNQKVAWCEGARNVFPSDLPADIEVLAINKAGPQFTSLNADILMPYKNLTHFYLEASHLQRVHEHTFRNSTSTLTTITFWDNKLTEIPTSLFSYAPNVILIGLGKNKFGVLQTKLFSDLKFLKSIDFRNNEITLIEKNCFHNLSSLETVHLNNNKMKTLSLNIMTHVNTLKILYLHNNPWDCKEKLCPLIHFINNRKLWGSEAVPSCSTPENIEGRKWNQLQHQDVSMSLSIKPNFLSVSEDDNITLECESCFPSELRWSRNGYELPLNYQKIYDKSPISKLTIPNVRKKQEGDYRCYIKNCTSCDHVGLFVEVKQQPSDICNLACNSYQ